MICHVKLAWLSFYCGAQTKTIWKRNLFFLYAQWKWKGLDSFWTPLGIIVWATNVCEWKVYLLGPLKKVIRFPTTWGWESDKRILIIMLQSSNDQVPLSMIPFSSLNALWEHHAVSGVRGPSRCSLLAVLAGGDMRQEGLKIWFICSRSKYTGMCPFIP